MIIILFVIALTLFLFSSFTVSYRLQTINRVVIYTPSEIFELSIPILSYEGSTGIHFDKNELQGRLKTYYDDNLKKVLPNYTMDLYFYNQNDQSICTSDSCQAVEVTISGTYMMVFKVSRSISYEIHRGV